MSQGSSANILSSFSLLLVAELSVHIFFCVYIPLRLKLDDLERQNDRLTAEFHKLAAEIEPDSLGHINIGG